MVTLGVSVYPDLRPMKEIRSYLKLAAQYGFARVFTSIFSIEGTPREVLACAAELNECAHEFGMEVSLDINPACMAYLGATPQDLSVFADVHSDILRMDGAYDEDDNVAMLANPYGMKIEYNASALTPQSIGALLARGIDKERILACHNFYPQRYTGFAWQKFLYVNEQLRAFDLRVGAFIASQTPGTHGVWDATCGLPTVERLRDYPADLQARILAATGTTEVFFGDAYASEDELASVQEAITPVEPYYLNAAHEAMIAEFGAYMSGGVRLDEQRKVRIEPLFDLTSVERAVLFDYFPHLDMGDSSEWIWRSRGPRVAFAGESIPPRRYPLAQFQRGDVVMVNNNYSHYAGEVQVVLEPLQNDGTRNLVARIDPQELTMFDAIHDGDVVVFIER